jgi:hypothetical protein
VLGDVVNTSMKGTYKKEGMNRLDKNQFSGIFEVLF